MPATGGYTPQAAPLGKRPRLARLCRDAGLLPLAARARALWRGDLRILAYHRVLETTEPAGFSFDLDLVSASAAAFERQMRLVKRHYSPMRFDELADCLDRGMAPPPRAVLVTFDDGYDDNHRVAYPILRALGMSAMFFVSTGPIDDGLPYAYDWLVHMVCSAPPGRFAIGSLGIDMDLPVGVDERRAFSAWLLDRLKTLDADAQAAAIAGLEAHWGMPRTQGHPMCRPMRWDALREMRRNGMEVGSHGVEHRMLAKLPRAHMRAEVAQSKARIEEELGARVDAISYPVGGPDAYDDEVVAAVREAGYRVACSYQAGAERASADARFSMRRLPVERQTDDAWFEAMLSLPEVFAYRSRVRNG